MIRYSSWLFNFKVLKLDFVVILSHFKVFRFPRARFSQVNFWSLTFYRDDVLPPPRSFEAIGSTPSSLWGEFTEDHEMGMCVSVDPQSGYRWNTRYCSGPDKAAFVCQIPGNFPFLWSWPRSDPHLLFSIQLSYSTSDFLYFGVGASGDTLESTLYNRDTAWGQTF